MERNLRKPNALPNIDSQTRTYLYFKKLDGTSPLQKDSSLVLDFSAINSDFHNLLEEPPVFIAENHQNSPLAYCLGIRSVLESFANIRKSLMTDIKTLNEPELFHATLIFENAFYNSENSVDFKGIPASQRRLLSYLRNAQKNNPGIHYIKEGKDFSSGAVATYKMLEFLWPRLYPKG